MGHCTHGMERCGVSSVCQSVPHPVCRPVCPPDAEAAPSACLSVCLSCLSVCLSVCLHVCLSVCPHTLPLLSSLFRPPPSPHNLSLSLSAHRRLTHAGKRALWMVRSPTQRSATRFGCDRPSRMLISGSSSRSTTAASSVAVSSPYSQYVSITKNFFTATGMVDPRPPPRPPRPSEPSANRRATRESRPTRHVTASK